MGILELAKNNERLHSGELLFSENEIDEICSGEQPKIISTVSLPEVNFLFGWKTARSTMHTDSLLTLCKVLGKLRSKILDDVGIEGRLLTPDQWEILYNSKAFQFFLNRRFRINAERASTEGVLDMILPANHKYTLEEIKNMGQLQLTASGLSNSVVEFRTGFLQLNRILQHYLGTNPPNPNTLLPFLGGVTGFRLGSMSGKTGRLLIAHQAIVERIRAIDALKNLDLAAVPGAVIRQRELLSKQDDT